MDRLKPTGNIFRRSKKEIKVRKAGEEVHKKLQQHISQILMFSSRLICIVAYCTIVFGTKIRQIVIDITRQLLRNGYRHAMKRLAINLSVMVSVSDGNQYGQIYMY